jgi:hypothetical protein
MKMDKVYQDLQFSENEFFRAYNLALKTAEAQASQLETQTDRRQEKNNGVEKDIELLRKQYATRKTAALEAATIKLRAIALGR